MPVTDAVFELLEQTTTEALHLETRDSYTPSDPDWLAWQAGERFDPVQRWPEWFELITRTVGRGVSVRRARIVSEPVTDYIRFEHEVTRRHNLAAGEQVRWLSRRAAWDLLVPGCDCWVFDRRIVITNVFDGDGEWVGMDRHDDPASAVRLADAFDMLWKRAISHEDYNLT
jgi:hypothetical protein